MDGHSLVAERAKETGFEATFKKKNENFFRLYVIN